MTSKVAGRVPRRWCAATAVGILMLTGCSAGGARGTPDVAVSRIGAPMREPVWSYRDGTLLGLTDDHRLAKIAYSGLWDARTRLSEPMDVGRNVQISQRDNRQVFVPQPGRNKVAVVDLTDLRPVFEVDAGPEPAYLAQDAGMRILLALSADGAAVTPVDQYGYRQLATAAVTGGPAEMIEGANRGRAIDYHLYGPSGIRYYQGPSSPPEERGSFTMDVGAAAGDGTQVTRSYVAARDGDVLCALDTRRTGRGMEVVGRAQLSSPIRYLGTDDTRIYAATDHDLTVLETASFIGYRNGTIPVVRTVDYRAALPAGRVAATPLSGMAVGPERVYLTLRGQPYMISVAKPRL